MTGIAATRDDLLATLVIDAKALVDAVQLDDTGQMVGQMWVGSNGGMLSRETLREADKVRRLLLALKGLK